MLDDDAQVDPATLLENKKLMAMLDEKIAEVAEARNRQDRMAAIVAAAVPTASQFVEQRVIARKGGHAREEDLRFGIAKILRQQGELVLTEARLPVPGWTAKLGGFDLAVVTDDSLVVAETKWADGNLRESMWDLIKLASVLAVPRVDAAVAVYGAQVKQWQKPESFGRLFEDRQIIVLKLLEALPKDWQRNLSGSKAQPLTVPAAIHVKLLSTTEIEVLGREWEVRAVSVRPDGGTFDLEAGWPHGVPPSNPATYSW